MDGAQPPVVARNVDTPLEELCRIRMAIRALVARERELKEHVLRETGPGRYEARDATLYLKESGRRVIDADSLPPRIRNNDRFWTEERICRLAVRPHEGIGDSTVLLRGDIVAVAHKSKPG